MKKIFKNLNTLFFTIILIHAFFIHSYAIKYTDGRFLSNVKVHKCVEELVKQHERYKVIMGEHGICFNRIVFGFSFNKLNNIVKDIELFVPVIDQDSVITFFVYVHPKKKLSSLELVNLFLNSNEFNEQDFRFEISNSTGVHDWCGDAVNQYDDKYSIATDITEENWQGKFLDPDMLWGCGPRSLLFVEIRPGEKVFVEGYEE